MTWSRDNKALEGRGHVRRPHEMAADLEQPDAAGWLICSWCKSEKPMESFRSDAGRRAAHGRSSRCNDCDNVYRACKRAVKPRLRRVRSGKFEGAVTPMARLDPATVRGTSLGAGETPYSWAKRLCGALT